MTDKKKLKLKNKKEWRKKRKKKTKQNKQQVVCWILIGQRSDRVSIGKLFPRFLFTHLF